MLYLLKSVVKSSARAETGDVLQTFFPVAETGSSVIRRDCYSSPPWWLSKVRGAVWAPVSCWSADEKRDIVFHVELLQTSVTDFAVTPVEPPEDRRGAAALRAVRRTETGQSSNGLPLESSSDSPAVFIYSTTYEGQLKVRSCRRIFYYYYETTYKL